MKNRTKTSFWLPNKFHADLKKFAKEEELSMVTLIILAVRQYMDKVGFKRTK